MLRFFSSKNSRQHYSEDGKIITEAVPLTNAPNQEWLAMSKRDIPQMVAKYIGQMETEESATWCKCVWQVHPDDELIKQGHCRFCDTKRNSGMHYTIDALPEDRYSGGDKHEFRGRRQKRTDDHPECPVHTREGMVMYFFEWVFTDAAQA